MSEIKINTENLEDQIDLMRRINQSLCGEASRPPEISGGGLMALGLQEFALLMFKVRDSLGGLFTDTAASLNRAGNSFINADNQLADNYKE